MFRFTVRDLLLVTVIIALALGWWADRRRLEAPPAAVRAYYRHHASLDEVVQIGKDVSAKDRSARINKLLANTDFTSVSQDGSCTVFYHSGFMAVVDCWHEILYSPKGYSGLPEYRRGGSNRLYELRELKEGRWFYVAHD